MYTLQQKRDRNILKTINYFDGFGQYYFDPLFNIAFGENISYSEGVKYLRDNGYNYLIVDIIFKLIPLTKKKDKCYITFKKHKEKYRVTYDLVNEETILEDEKKLLLIKYDFCDSTLLSDESLKFCLTRYDTPRLFLLSEY